VNTPSGRADRLAALGSRTFDLLVVGGGITGCGIALDAALRGLDVALVEKNDFASGTSSRSSRLIHGGVRYLEHGHLHLVFESSAERRRLLRLAPHLVHPLEFTWPVYTGARIPRWKLSAGLFLYDALSLFRNVGRHRRLSARDVLAREPAVRETGLRGGARYFDAGTDDVRLTLAIALSAAEAGATIVNHACVKDLRVSAGQVVGAVVADRLDAGHSTPSDVVDVRARVVVNATGPWSDELRHLDGETRSAVRGSRGTHIAVPRDRLGARGALTVLAPKDGRVCFVLPREGLTVVGTTDSFTDDSPDDVRATADDVTYLVDVANSYFPNAHLSANDVVSAWAGIRPLLPTADRSPRSASREHMVIVSEHGLVSITGGKLTTYRVMAADVVDVALRRLGRPPSRALTERRHLYGGDVASIDEETLNAARVIGDQATAARLVRTHGSKWRDVWAAISSSEEDRPRLDDSDVTNGELRYAVQREMAETLGDLLIRRTRLAFERPDHGKAIARDAAWAIAPVLGWDDARIEREIAAFIDEVDRIFTIQEGQSR
jgi:glycerol-3-phosphate dehydrogenase